MLDQIKNFLVNNSIGTFGTDLFEYSQPDNPDSCITLYETGGFPSDLVSDIEYPTFQVIVRDLDAAAGAIKIQNIYKALHQNTTIFTDSFIMAMQPPAGIGQDETGRHEFSVNFKIIKHID